MAVVTYYANKYFRDASNVAQQELPLCQPGELKTFEDAVVIASGGQLIVSDLIKFARMPAGHKPVRMEMWVSADIDSGSSLAFDVGTTAYASQLAAAVSFGGSAVGLVFPTGVPLIYNLTAATPDAAYDILATLTGAAGSNAAAAAATLTFRLFYTNPGTAYDPADGPSAVLGTQ